MKGIPYVFLARGLGPLLILLITGCQTANTSMPETTRPIINGWQAGQKITMEAFCRSEKSIMAIADGDRASKEAAEAAFLVEAKKRNCVSFGQPRFIGVVAEVLAEYPDWGGETTQVLRIISPRAPGQNFYILALKNLAKKVHYDHRQPDCANCRGA